MAIIKPPIRPLGFVRNRPDCKTFLDSYATNPAWTAWVRSGNHFTMPMSYAAVSWVTQAGGQIPVICYRDAFTKFGTNGLNEGTRNTYKGEVAGDISKGFSGEFMDDWNWASTTSGNIPGSEAELLALTKNVREAIGAEGILEVNPQYGQIKTGMPVEETPLYQRIAESKVPAWPNATIKAAAEETDLFDKEFALGPNAGISSPGAYKSYLTYIEILHNMGIQIHISGASGSSGVASWEYNLATYFLHTEQAINQKPGRIAHGGDYFNTLEEKPEEPATQTAGIQQWWAGLEVNLGNAVQTFREAREGLTGNVYKRTYEKGIIYVIAPGGGSQAVTLPAGTWETIQGGTKAGGTSVTLTANAPGGGLILKQVGGGGETVPVNSSVPVITGTPEEGKTLTSSQGTWTGSPTSFAYQWLRNNVAIGGATSATYLLVAADVGTKIAVTVTASNAKGNASATSAQTATITTPPPPANTALPVVSGTAEVGRTLTTTNGTWSGSPTGFTYQWLRGGVVVAGTSNTYVLTVADEGKKMQSRVTATNAKGSASATSLETAVVAPEGPHEETFGTLTVGALKEKFGTERKRMWKYPLPQEGNVNKLSIYLEPSGVAGEQKIKGLIYSDNAGNPEFLLAQTNELIWKSTNAEGWYDLVFASPVSLAPGNYWIGVMTGTTPSVIGYRYENIANIRAYNTNVYTSGPSNPFGIVERNAEQNSIYASYSVGGPTEVPVNQNIPTITGTAEEGKVLTCNPGVWKNSPTSTAKKWLRCDASGLNPVIIAAATGVTYTLVAADVGHTIRVRETATNGIGQSAPIDSPATAVVASSGPEVTKHYEYVFGEPNGLVNVYDIDNGWALVETFNLVYETAGLLRGARVRGLACHPGTHTLFVFYGGDGGGTGGPGKILAWDLVTKSVRWRANYPEGVDDGEVTRDGTKIYLSKGELAVNGWYVIDATNGAILEKIEPAGAKGPHNTTISADGTTMLLGPRFSGTAFSYNIPTKTLGPGMVTKAGAGAEPNGVRPLTINSKNTIAFVCPTEFAGIQIFNIATGALLYTIESSVYTKPFFVSTANHGVSLSPDDKEVYFIDEKLKAVQAYDVHGVAEGIAPVKLASIPVQGFEGTETGCTTYDCERIGWCRHTRDGKWVIAGDSGAIINTTTRTVSQNITSILNSRQSIEIDWLGGVPVASTGRFGIGYPSGVNLQATLGPSGKVVRKTSRSLKAALNKLSGGLQKKQAFQATLAVAGSIGRKASRAIEATLEFQAKVIKESAFIKIFTPTLGPSGKLNRKSAHKLLAALNGFSGRVAFGEFIRAFGAALSPSGSLKRGVRRGLAAVLSPSATIFKATNKIQTLKATFGFNLGFPSSTLLESFARPGGAVEEPLSNGGKWSLLYPGVKTGESRGNAYFGSTFFEIGEDAAYWNVGEFTNPVVQATYVKEPEVGQRTVTLWACVNGAGTAGQTGYRLVVEYNGNFAFGAVLYIFRLEKQIAGAFTPLVETMRPARAGDKFGLQVYAGEVSSWISPGAASRAATPGLKEGWYKINEAADASYSTGVVGIGSRSQSFGLSNFQAANSTQPLARLVSHKLLPLLSPSGGLPLATGKFVQVLKAKIWGKIFGTIGPGALKSPLSTVNLEANQKIANAWYISRPMIAVQLSVWLQIPPGQPAGERHYKGFIYRGAGNPELPTWHNIEEEKEATRFTDEIGGLVAVTPAGTIKTPLAGSGQYAFNFASPVYLPPGPYWIGVIADNQAPIIGINQEVATEPRNPAGATSTSDVYATGPSDPFGPFTKTTMHYEINVVGELPPTLLLPKLQYTQSATLGFAVSLPRKASRALSALLGPIGNLFRSRYPLQAALALKGNLATLGNLVLQATLTFAVATPKKTVHALKGALNSLAGKMKQIPGRSFAPTLGPSGKLSYKTVTQQLATLNLAGRVSSSFMLRQLKAMLDGVSGFLREVHVSQKPLQATLKTAGAVVPKTIKEFSANLELASTLALAGAFLQRFNPRLLVGTRIGTIGKYNRGEEATSARKANFIWASQFPITERVNITRLTVYLQAAKAGQQRIKGVIYSDVVGEFGVERPDKLIATTQEFIYNATMGPGWYDLIFITPVTLLGFAAGNIYWLGIHTGEESEVFASRVDGISGIGAGAQSEERAYSSGPSSTFAIKEVTTEQMAIYAAYIPVNSMRTRVMHQLAGLLSPSGKLGKLFKGRKLLATLEPAGQLSSKLKITALKASFSVAGALGRLPTRALLAKLSPVGKLTKEFNAYAKVLEAALNPVAKVSHSLFNRTISATLSMQVTLSSALKHTLKATFSTAGSLPYKTTAYLQHLAGEISTSGNVVLKHVKTLEAALIISAELEHFVTSIRKLAAQLTTQVAMVRLPIKPFKATLATAGFIKRKGQQILRATLSPEAALLRKIRSALRATLTPAGTLVRVVKFFRNAVDKAVGTDSLVRAVRKPRTTADESSFGDAAVRKLHSSPNAEEQVLTSDELTRDAQEYIRELLETANTVETLERVERHEYEEGKFDFVFVPYTTEVSNITFVAPSDPHKPFKVVNNLLPYPGMHWVSKAKQLEILSRNT